MTTETCEDCDLPSVSAFCRINDRRCSGLNLLCANHARSRYEKWSQDVSAARVRHSEAAIGTVLVEPSLVTYDRWRGLVVLTHTESRASLPIIGSSEAVMRIYRSLEGSVLPEDQVHHAFSTIVGQMGTILGVAITDAKHDVEHGYIYSAEVLCEHVKRSVSARIRPTDAIAIAIISKSSICVNESVWRSIWTDEARRRNNKS